MIQVLFWSDFKTFCSVTGPGQDYRIGDVQNAANVQFTNYSVYHTQKWKSESVSHSVVSNSLQAHGL